MCWLIRNSIATRFIRIALALLVFSGWMVWAGAERSAMAAGLTLADLAAADPAVMERGVLMPESAPPGRVHLDVVVTDAAGKPVTGLQAQDFTLLEDNKPIKILDFQSYDGTKADGATAKPDPAVKAMLVIDAVNNGFTELNFIRQGLEQFLRQNGGRTALPIALLLFTNDGMKPLSPPTRDGNALADLVEKMNPSIRPQGIYPFSLSVLALERLAQDEKEDPGRKLLLWPGSGWVTPLDDQEVMTKGAERNRQHHFDSVVLLSAALREARIALYGGFAASSFYDRDFLKGVRRVNDVDPRNLSLSVLALESGGRGDLPYVNRDSDLSGQLNSFLVDANSFYTLGFDPPATERADEYHDLKVVVAKPGLTARTNTGYYNHPAMSSREEALSYAVPKTGGGQLVREFEGRPVTVAELEGLVKHEAGERDGTAAKDLFRLQLTERLSTTRLAAMKAELPGVHAKAALTALADGSVFLKLPASEVPADAAPDITQQRTIVSMAVSYLRDTILRLPNFYATRTTERFEDTSDAPGGVGVSIGAEPMHDAGVSAATVIYRDHKEVVDGAKGKKRDSYENVLVTRGTFGPILSTAMVDAAHGQMRFSHWEQGEAGKLAVFQFHVTKEESHYEVAFRKPGINGDDSDQEKPTAYHGEVALDVKTGTIQRLALISDPEPNSAMLRADVMVEYGTVEIGGKNYVCPVRSVSLSQGVAGIVGNGAATRGGFTRINDVTFTNYHVFRAEMKVVTGDGGD
jgi:VWFA-related protein